MKEFKWCYVDSKKCRKNTWLFTAWNFLLSKVHHSVGFRFFGLNLILYHGRFKEGKKC
jgi:hypothetical protein